MIEDLEAGPTLPRTAVGPVYPAAGVRAMQSTPLIDRSTGSPIGVFSIYFRSPRKPEPRTLRLLDLLARQTTDILGRAHTDGQPRRETV